MKGYLRTIKIWLVVFIVIYLAGVYIGQDFDITSWHVLSRGLHIFLSIILTGMFSDLQSKKKTRDAGFK